MLWFVKTFFEFLETKTLFCAHKIKFHAAIWQFYHSQMKKHCVTLKDIWFFCSFFFFNFKVQICWKLVFCIAKQWQCDVFMCVCARERSVFCFVETLCFEKLVAKLRKQNKDRTWKWDYKVWIYKCFVLSSKCVTVCFESLSMVCMQIVG